MLEKEKYIKEIEDLLGINISELAEIVGEKPENLPFEIGKMHYGNGASSYTAAAHLALKYCMPVLKKIRLQKRGEEERSIEYLQILEHSSCKYPPRTFHNAFVADLTLAFADDLTTSGEKLTLKAAEGRYFAIDMTDILPMTEVAVGVASKIAQVKAPIINIAGNGIYTFRKTGMSQDSVNSFVFNILAMIHGLKRISKIVSGGQTGVDIAGAVAGYALGIPVEVTMPKGFRQRHKDNKDKNIRKLRLESK